MKGYFVLLSIIALSAASNTFLRNMAGAISLTVNSIKTDGDVKCTKTAADFVATMKINIKPSAAVSTGFDSRLTIASGSNKVEYKVTGQTFSDTNAVDVSYDLDTTATPTTSIKAGVYTFSKLVDETSGGAKVTFDTAKAAVTYKFIEEYKVAKTQSKTSQEVDSKSDKAEEKQFVVDLDEEFAGSVFFYPNSTCTQPISCTASKKVVTCTPTTADMENDKEYEIYYQSGCEDAAKAGIKVKFSASSFVTFSKYAMVVLALFLF